MTTISVSSVNVSVLVGGCSVNPILISVPPRSISVTAGAPIALTSCILEFPRLPSDDNVIPAPSGTWVPIAPGIGTLPGAPTIVDTSPDQLIGCVNALLDDPQSVLDTLFPGALAGDGVIHKSTGDFWVYDGTNWNNVGPNPGPTVVEAKIVPVWNETIILSARTRTQAKVLSLPYPLFRETELPFLDTVTQVLAASVKLVRAAESAIDFSVLTPTVEVRPRKKGKVVEVLRFFGNNDTNGQTFEANWDVGQVWGGINLNGYYLYACLLESNAMIQWVSYSQTYSLNNSVSVNGRNVTFRNISGNPGFNQSNTPYVFWLFRCSMTATTNTSGTIPTQVRKGEVMSVVTYNGTSNSSTTIGHGLGVTPDLVLIKKVSTSFDYPYYIMSPKMGTGFFQLSYSNSASSAAQVVSQYNQNTVTLANDAAVNGNGSGYSATFFASVPGKSKIGTYTGNDLPGGQFVDMGFEVAFVLVKAINGTGRWIVIDYKLGPTSRFAYHLSQYSLTSTPSVGYSLEGKGIRFYNGAGGVSESNLNGAGVTYLYMAFALGDYLRLSVPSTTISASAPVPTVSSGKSVFVPGVTLSLTVLTPPYAGVRSTVVAVPPLPSVATSAGPVAVSSGTSNAVPASIVSCLANAPAYCGQAGSDAKTYIQVVEFRDGQALESSVKAAVYNLVRSLTIAGIYDKIELLAPFIGPRTIEAAFTTIKGGAFYYYGLPLSSYYEYNRESGLKIQNTQYPQAISGYSELPVTDNHLAGLFTTAPTLGGDLIGVTGNYYYFITRWWANATTEYRCFGNNFYSSTGSSWTAPMFFGMSRDNSSTFTARTSGSTSTFTSSVTYNYSGSLTLFPGGWNGRSNARVAIVSAGRSLDMALLEPILRSFHTDISAAIV